MGGLLISAWRCVWSAIPRLAQIERNGHAMTRIKPLDSVSKRLSGSGPELVPRLGYTGQTVHAGLERSDNIGSFEELAMPLFARLFNFACWLTQDRGEAEELVQDTFMKALKGFRSFEQGTNFRAWIYRILRNTFLTTRAGLKVYDSLDEDGAYEPESTQTPELLLLARSSRETLHLALEQLPAKFREVILLCDLEEMSYQEIAETLAIPTGTVMSRLWRARRAMRGLLKDMGHGGAA